MRIYRNNAHVELDLEEFLGVLETGTFEELLMMIMELDDGASDEAEYAYEEFEFDTEEDLQEFLNSIEDGQYDHIEVIHINEEIMEQVVQDFMGKNGLSGFYIGAGEEGWLTAEDKKVRRILDRYRDVSGDNPA